MIFDFHLDYLPRYKMTLTERIKQAFFDYIDQNHTVPNYLLVNSSTQTSLLDGGSDLVKIIPMDTGMADIKFLGYEVGVSDSEETPFIWKMK